MKDCPHKCPDKRVIENDKFLVNKVVVGSVLELSSYRIFFYIGQVLIKNTFD